MLDTKWVVLFFLTSHQRVRILETVNIFFINFYLPYFLKILFRKIQAQLISKKKKNIQVQLYHFKLILKENLEQVNLC